MKTLELKPSNEGGPNTAELIKLVVNNRPQQGYDVEEMRKRFRILDAVDAADGELLLEDADAKKLQDLTKAMRWNLMSREVLEFSDAVTGMRTVKLEAEEKNEK